MGNHSVLKGEEARKRLEKWYQKFFNRIDFPVESREVPTSYGVNHVLVAGDTTKPPLVCLHAMLTSSAHMLSTLGPLLDQFHIIAPDLPGQSVKGLPKRLPYDDDSHVKWLQEILDELNLKEVNLFGVSLGGFIARKFASSNPEFVKKLILLVPAGIVQGSVFKGLIKMALPMLMYKINPSEKRLRNLVGYLITTWDDDWAYYLGDAFNDFAINSRIPPTASNQELKKLSMPCLIMAAENDISFPGGPLIKRAKSQIPDIETELIKDSRHCPPTTEEFQNWMANRITKFFNEHQNID